MGRDDDALGYFVARRFAKPWKPGPRKHPKMPRGPWWIASIVCFLVGTAIGIAIFGQDGAGLVRAIACGVGGWVIGMFVVETVWERRSGSSSVPGPPTD